MVVRRSSSLPQVPWFLPLSFDAFLGVVDERLAQIGFLFQPRTHYPVLLAPISLSKEWAPNGFVAAHADPRSILSFDEK
jgi:hypothetical protein